MREQERRLGQERDAAMNWHWHALAVEVGSEDVIYRSLMSFRGVTPYRPTYTTEGVEQRRRRTKCLTQVQHNALPGYILIEAGPLAYWPEIQALDGVIEPLKAAGSDDYHVIPQEQIDLLKKAEAVNFGYPISMSKDDELEIGDIVLALLGMEQRKGRVIEIGKRRAKVDFGVPISVPVESLKRA